MKPGLDCWEVLGLSPTRDVTQIRKAYRQLAKQLHPDSHSSQTSSSTARFIALNSAQEEALRRAEQGALLPPSAPHSPAPDPRESVVLIHPLLQWLESLPLGNLKRALGSLFGLLLISAILEGWELPDSEHISLLWPISIFQGFCDALWISLLSLLLFFWIPGLIFLVLCGVGLRTQAIEGTLIVLWLAGWGTLGFGWEVWIAWDTILAVRRSVSALIVLGLVPMMLLLLTYKSRRG